MSKHNTKHYKPRNRNITLEQHIGNRVFLMRHARDLTIKDVSSAIGVSYQQLQKYEKGQNRIAASTLYALARYYKVSIDFFYQDYKNDSQKPPYETTIEGTKVMNALNDIKDQKSRKQILSHVIPIIDAFNVYYADQAIQLRCKEMPEKD